MRNLDMYEDIDHKVTITRTVLDDGRTKVEYRCSCGSSNVTFDEVVKKEI